MDGFLQRNEQYRQGAHDAPPGKKLNKKGQYVLEDEIDFSYVEDEAVKLESIYITIGFHVLYTSPYPFSCLFLFLFSFPFPLSRSPSLQLPTFSPRPPLDVDPSEAKAKSDKREERDRNHYLEKHPEIMKLIEYFEMEILLKKPGNVVEFGYKLFSDEDTVKAAIGVEVASKK